MTDLLIALYGNSEFRILVVLVLAVLVLGVVSSLKAGDFQFVQLKDVLTEHLLPMTVGYGVASLIDLVTPDLAIVGYVLPPLRELAFAAFLLYFVPYILSHLSDLTGMPLPSALQRTAAVPKG